MKRPISFPYNHLEVLGVKKLKPYIPEKKMIYEYECQRCGKVQEKIHKLSETNSEPCSVETCQAPADQLKKVMSLTAGKHSSWSKW